MSIKLVRNKIMEFIINGNNNNEQKPNKISLEAYVNRDNNIEYNYLPFVDFEKNQNTMKNKNTMKNENDNTITNPIPDDHITKFYIIGLSFLGIYMLNSVLKKK